MSVRILNGDCRDVLRSLPAESVHCCITSPPYWGLRDYGTAKWEGGEPGCDHVGKRSVGASTLMNDGRKVIGLQSDHKYATIDVPYRDVCAKCGARRIDSQIGLESTIEAYVETMVAVFREVRRILRKDGTLWLNLGDGFCSGGRATWRSGASENKGQNVLNDMPRPAQPAGLKPKDLIGMPWRVAFALQADGWWLRQDIIWCLSGGTWLYARTPSKVGPMMLKDLIRLKPETVELWNGERWTGVIAWTKRSGRAGSLELVLRSGERIGCTDNHIWPTQRGNVSAGEIRRGDIVQTAILPTGESPAGWLERGAFWFAGLYLAEGSRSGSTIQISGHIKEESRLARLRDLVAYYGGSARAYRSGNAQNIHIDSIGLSAVLQSLIGGHTAKDKHIHPSAWRYRNWALKELANGYLEGDGHYEPHNERIRLGLCRNYFLERDLRTLAARLGATLTLKSAFSKNRTGRFPSFKGEWRWERSGHHNEKDRGEVIEVRNSRARQFWDVSVADDPHLFALASGVLTHNSKPNPMPESVTDRTTKSHEYLFLLSKSANYFYDAEAIKEPSLREGDLPGGKHCFHEGNADRNGYRGDGGMKGLVPPTRNRRSVWEIATAPFPEAHFATFPPALVEPCVRAGTSEKGCCAKCGAPWAREVENRPTIEPVDYEGKNADTDPQSAHRRMLGNLLARRQQTGNHQNPFAAKTTLGWSPSCSCAEIICENGCTVLDVPHGDKQDKNSKQPQGGYENLPAMRGGISRAKRNEQMVQSGLPSSLGCENSEVHEGEDGFEQGLCADSQTGSSNGGVGRLCDGAQASDGGEFRSLFDEGRDCSPRQWHQGGQSPRKSRIDAQEATRQEQEANLSRDVPALPKDIPASGECPCCRGRLIQRPFPTVPATILDCFGGAGTTGLVADRLGRNAVLIELNPEYVAMAEKRLRGDAPLFAQIAAE